MQTHRYATILFLLIAGGIFLVAPAAAIYTTSDLSGSQPLVRGQQFAITITGIPNTAYYVWLTKTWPLSGEPGDQPPIIANYQENVEKDPEGGPYTIGSYTYSNGDGRTIRDDVAPSTPSMSNTNYYALVTTDRTGQAVVAFQTSANTALRSYSVRVENPTSVNNESLFVQYGKKTVNPGSVSIGTVTTRPTKATTTVTTMPTPTETLTLQPATPVPQATETPASAPPATQKASAATACSILATGAAMLAAKKR